MEPSKRVNRLAGETSPYLLQHARNPVDWFPWSPEALDKARREDKPIFLSVGYSACHWCHVMAHESFENEETARLMNEWFVNVKVDREERPDLDSVYMKAVVALTGQGGWPLSAFLTPGLEPYFGGTYFPPVSSHGRPGFPQVLKQAYDLYRNDKAQVKSRAGGVLPRLNPEKSGRKDADAAWEKIAGDSAAVMAEKFDETSGGFGSGMKFPEPMVYSLLLRHWLRTHSSESLAMVDKSLTQMAEGGIFDQLGGGFHRYSTDPQWRVPHFEKMLDDNALMARLYLDAFQATKQELYSVTASEILGYVLREMVSPEGAFYSSQDADAGGSEGRYYVWDLKEVLELLGPRNAKVFARAFGVSPAGAFGGRNVLCVKDSLEKISAEEDIPIFEVHHIVKTGKQALLERRALRAQPGRDEKILTAWNGLTIAALATGHSVLRNGAWLDAAVRCAGFLWSSLWDGERLLRVYKDGQARIDGFLDDYACLTEGFAALYEASFDAVWIDRATRLAGRMIDLFWDEQDGGFFMTGKLHEKLIARPKNPADEAGPSANAIAAQALLRLGRLTGRKEFLEKGEGTLKAFQAEMEARPAAHNGLLSAADFLSKPPLEIVIAGPRRGPAFEEILRAVHRDYRPNKILVHAGDGEEGARLPLAEGRVALKGEPTVYVCQDRTCHPPAQTASALSNLLEPPPLIKLNLYDEEKHAAEKTAQETDNFLNAMSRIFKYSGLGGGNP